MISLARVDPRYPGAWAQLEPYLDEALERGGAKSDWLTEDIYVGAAEGRLMLWALIDGEDIFGALCTVVSGYPRRAVLEVLAMGCDPHKQDQWLELLEQLKAHARASGLSAIIGTGRPGWARKLGGSERRVFELEL